VTEETWCLTGELSLEAAQRLELVIEQIADLRGEFPPTLSYFEQKDSPLWCTQIFFSSAPDYGFINNMLQTSGLMDWNHDIAPVENKDWVSESQKLLTPVEAGRFFVFGSHDRDKARSESLNLQIEAGQAFGTGKHETTAACLESITALAADRTPCTVLDLGTGSGVLALAAHKLWPNARVCASDIDPIAIKVTAENITINGGTNRTVTAETVGIALMVADGLNDPVFATDQPFDLIIANILAGPLIEMAANISAALAGGGKLILSGLLCTQEKEVLDAYKARGLVSLGRIEKDDWLALTLQKP